MNTIECALHSEATHYMTLRRLSVSIVQINYIYIKVYVILHSNATAHTIFVCRTLYRIFKHIDCYIMQIIRLIRFLSLFSPLFVRLVSVFFFFFGGFLCWFGRICHLIYLPFLLLLASNKKSNFKFSKLLLKPAVPYSLFIY